MFDLGHRTLGPWVPPVRSLSLRCISDLPSGSEDRRVLLVPPSSSDSRRDGYESSFVSSVGYVLRYSCGPSGGDRTEYRGLEGVLTGDSDNTS